MTADLDFFWDPVCPWAWITSRWVNNVQALRPIEVDWRFIALKIVNEEKVKGYSPEMLERYGKVHGMGYTLLNVAAAVREKHGPEPLGALYTAFGTRIHVDRNAPSLRETAGVASVLESLGLDPALADIGDAFEDVVRADTELALERAGRDIGTPVLTFAPPDGYSFFGPVISKAPTGDDALKLWDTVETLAGFPGFAELKRSIRSTPEV